VNDRVFVYGTLKRGGSNHGLIAGRYSTVSPAVVLGMLFDLGPFPAAVFRGNRYLYGEVFEFEDVTAVLPALDMLEGCPTLYRRIRIPLLDPATLGTSGMGAWAYEYVNSESLGQDNLIPSGEWEISRT